MQPVLDYLKRNQARFVAELCDYLRLPGVSAQEKHKPDLHASAQWLANHCRQAGLVATLRKTEGNPIVIARTPRRRDSRRRQPHFLVYGHYDVQPPDPLELWQSPPFEPRIDGRS
ncbi:MAG: peptidase M20, partial [Verrucomicrobia bacterium]|nr:peptidase M20 [Verrucomicrobiota bacterium]